MHPTWQEVQELTQQFRNIKTEYWLSENVFTLSWWILSVTSLCLLIVWIIILDKKRIMEIITYGFFVGTIAILADIAGFWL
ncbi:hypothetical protein [Lysinibacillus irui]|nr:hypothetical protein [Lysinibacillus irui]MEA0562376.1 hypothetical protein [Lysinibacillus irui]